MKSNWERMGMPLMQWLAVPLSVFAFCYFVVGPAFGSNPTKAAANPQESQVSETNKQPIQPGKRKWIPVSPPQVNISVTPAEQDPPVQDDGTVPLINEGGSGDGATSDEGSSSGVTAPPVKAGGGEVAQGDPEKKEDQKGAFKGIGHSGGN